MYVVYFTGPLLFDPQLPQAMYMHTNIDRYIYFIRERRGIGAAARAKKRSQNNNCNKSNCNEATKKEKKKKMRLPADCEWQRGEFFFFKDSSEKKNQRERMAYKKK